MFLIKILDFLVIPLSVLAGILMWTLRRIGLEKLYFSSYIIDFIGVMPIRDHYYEPQFVFTQKEIERMNQRKLSGLDMNIDVQLSFLSKFEAKGIHSELVNLKFGCIENSSQEHKFKFMNGSFEAGDAEIYFSFIRLLKPKKIIEIGSGNSTLVALEAAQLNSYLDNIQSEITCIEPYEMNWLEDTNVKVIRDKVEDLNIDFFKSLQENDILFIDSSHIIRPNGDVLFNLLTILPLLNKNVYIHIHDIFTPNNYPASWIIEKKLLWNEQYILEGLLSGSNMFEIVMANNFMCKNYFNNFKINSPFIKKESEPGSFWIRKIK